MEFSFENITSPSGINRSGGRYLSYNNVDERTDTFYSDSVLDRNGDRFNPCYDLSR